MWYYYILAGIGFGIVGGMGMGGGIILIPVLTLLLQVNQHAAQGMNLAAFLPMSLLALITHIKNKRVDFRMALLLSLTGLLGALGGAWLVIRIEEGLLRKLFGGFLVLLGCLRAYRIVKNAKGQSAKGRIGRR